MKLDDPLRDLRPAPPPSSLRARVLTTAAERSRQIQPIATTAGGRAGDWIFVALVLLLAHAWVTWANERASGTLLRELGFPASPAARSASIFLASALE